MASWWQVCLSLFTFILIKESNARQRCYICIPNVGVGIRDVIQLYPSGPPIPLCNKFEPGRKEFIRECPQKHPYIGCLTETNGTHVTKTCSTVNVDDCNTANGINYCFCTGDICNSEQVPKEENRPAIDVSQESRRPTGQGSIDDEDVGEGSGDSAELDGHVANFHPITDIITVKTPPEDSPEPKLSSASSTSVVMPAIIIAVALLVRL